MRGNSNRRRLAALLFVIVVSFGCNPLLLPFYIFSDGVTNSKQDPEFKLYDVAKREKKKKEITIVLIPYRNRSLSPDHFSAARQLAGTYVRQLEERFKANKQNVKIVPMRDVDKFQASHAVEWKTMSAAELGKQFDADYVIHMELMDLSLYERGSNGMLFNGFCRVSLSVHDVAKVGEEPAFTRDYPLHYPKSGPRVADMDNGLEKFKQDFFAQVATRLSWALTHYPTGERCECE